MKNRIQEMRWERNWSQEQLARIAKVSRFTINRIENEQPDVRTSTSIKIAKAFKTEVSDLFEA